MKVKKIIFVYDDSIEYLLGEEAQEWLDTVNHMCFSLAIRGQNPFDEKKFNWKKKRKLKKIE